MASLQGAHVVLGCGTDSLLRLVLPALEQQHERLSPPWRGSYKIRTEHRPTKRKPGQIPGQFCYQPSDGLPLKLKGLIDGKVTEAIFWFSSWSKISKAMKVFLVFPVRKDRSQNSKVISLVSAG